MFADLCSSFTQYVIVTFSGELLYKNWKTLQQCKIIAMHDITQLYVESCIIEKKKQTIVL